MKLTWMPASGLALLTAALWWGSLTVTGFITVPLLFTHLPSPAMAGNMAAKLFTAQTWIALGCGLLLMALSRGREATARMDWANGALLFVAGGVLLALLAEFAVAPRILARQNLKLWHGLGSAMYFVQWVCAGVTLWRVAGHHASHPHAGEGPPRHPRAGEVPPRHPREGGDPERPA